MPPSAVWLLVSWESALNRVGDASAALEEEPVVRGPWGLGFWQPASSGPVLRGVAAQPTVSSHGQDLCFLSLPRSAAWRMVSACLLFSGSLPQRASRHGVSLQTGLWPSWHSSVL